MSGIPIDRGTQQMAIHEITISVRAADLIDPQAAATMRQWALPTRPACSHCGRTTNLAVLPDGSFRCIGEE